MLSNNRLYIASGALFLLAFFLDLPDVELHGWLFLLVSLACFGVALYRTAKPLG